MVGKRTKVSSQNVFDLFLLETTFDNEAACTIDTSSCTHFGEEELDNVFGLCITSQRCIPHQMRAATAATHLSVHLLANLGNVGKDGFFVSFSEQLWWSDGVPFSRSRGEERRVGGVKRVVESGQELYNAIDTWNTANDQ